MDHAYGAIDFAVVHGKAYGMQFATAATAHMLLSLAQLQVKWLRPTRGPC